MKSALKYFEHSNCSAFARRPFWFALRLWRKSTRIEVARNVPTNAFITHQTDVMSSYTHSFWLVIACKHNVTLYPSRHINAQTIRTIVMMAELKGSWETSINAKGEYVRKESQFRNWITGATPWDVSVHFCWGRGCVSLLSQSNHCNDNQLTATPMYLCI